MTQPGHVAVVGSINADLGVSVERFPHPGETIPASGGTFSPGGKGANQALAARMCGAQVTMIGAVGDDPAAAPALELLRAADVDLSQVHTATGPTGIAVVAVDAHGENQIMVIPGANATMDDAQVAAATETIASASVVVLQGEIPASGIQQAADLATGHLVLNMAPVIPLPARTITKANPLVVNEHEAALTLHLLDPDAPPPADPEQALTALHEHGCQTIVMTLGARGAVVCDHGTITPVAPTVVDHVVDTTGAGDAFVGALASQLATGADLVQACSYANKVAATTVSRPGAQSSYADITTITEAHQ